MNYQPINLDAKFRLVRERWQPRVIAEVNDYQLKIVRVEGDFVWYNNEDTDEAFVVIDGELRIDFRDGSVTVGPGELYVVPRGRAQAVRGQGRRLGLALLDDPLVRSQRQFMAGRRRTQADMLTSP